MRYFVLALLIVTLISPTPAFGHGNPRQQETQIEVILPADPKALPSEEELRELMAEGHEAIDSEDEDQRFLRRWVEKFNFKRKLIHTVRWYKLKSGHLTTRDHAINIALMYLTSHTLETIGGVALASAGLDPTLDLWWPYRALFWVIGTGITIPGLDPLCIALGWFYAKKPLTMDRVLQYPRLFLVKSTSLLARVTGVNLFFDWMLEKVDAQQFLEKILVAGVPGTYVYNATAEKFEVTLRDNKQVPLATLALVPSGKQALTLTEATIFNEGLTPEARSYLDAQLKPFRWNVRDALSEAAALLAAGNTKKLASRTHIEKVTPVEGGTVIQFKRGGVTVEPHRRNRLWQRIKDKLHSCANYLQGLSDAR